MMRPGIYIHSVGYALSKVPSGKPNVNEEAIKQLMFKFRNPFKPARELETAHSIYSATINAARDPHFFTAWQVPDTPEGRFEILALTAFLVLKRLKSNAENADLAQAYFDIMFEDIDANLRELGVGDMSIGKKIKKLAEGFYGRIRAYENGLTDADNNETLKNALSNYVYRDNDPSPESLQDFAAHIRRQDHHLSTQSDEAIWEGQLSFVDCRVGA